MATFAELAGDLGGQRRRAAAARAAARADVRPHVVGAGAARSSSTSTRDCACSRSTFRATAARRRATSYRMDESGRAGPRRGRGGGPGRAGRGRALARSRRRDDLRDRAFGQRRRQRRPVARGGAVRRAAAGGGRCARRAGLRPGVAAVLGEHGDRPAPGLRAGAAARVDDSERRARARLLVRPARASRRDGRVGAHRPRDVARRGRRRTRSSSGGRQERSTSGSRASCRRRRSPSYRAADISRSSQIRERSRSDSL